MEVRYKKAAIKYLKKMPKDKANRFFRAFLRISKGDTKDLNISPFRALKDGYRLRIGDYRAIYTILENELSIEVIKIGARGDIYK